MNNSEENSSNENNPHNYIDNASINQSYNPQDEQNPLNDKSNSEVDYKNSRLIYKINRNLTQIIQQKINPDLLTFETLLPIVKSHPINRSIENTSILKSYLHNSPLQDKYEEDNLPSPLYEKLTAILSIFTEYKYIDQPCELYKGGDPPSSIYVILQGSGVMSSLEKKTVQMTGQEYFNKLNDLKDSKNHLILKKTIRDNYQVLPVNLLDLNRINLIVLKLLYQNDTKSSMSIRELLIKARINPSDIDIDFNRDDSAFIDSYIHQLQSKITKSDCRKYSFLLDNRDKHPVNLFEFNSVRNLKSGDFIGSIENDMYAHSISLDAGTHLCSIKYDTYIESIKAEKNKLLNREINFLLKHFFFNSISRKKFIYQYYPFFTHQKLKKRDVIFNENNQVEFVYFIQEGDAELSSNMSILQMHSLIDVIRTKLEKQDFMEFIQTKSHPKTIMSQLKERRTMKLYILSEREAIGHESFYFQMNHLFSCRVNSEVLLLYKIAIKNLLHIFKEEYDAFEDFKTQSIKRIEILTDRLTFVTNINTGLIDSKNYAIISQIIKDEPLKQRRKFPGKIIEKKDLELNLNKMTLIKSSSMPNQYTEKGIVIPTQRTPPSLKLKISVPLPLIKKRRRRRKDFEERIVANLKREIKESKLVFANETIEEAQVKRKEYKKLLDDSRKNNSLGSSLSFMTQLNRQLSVKHLKAEVIDYHHKSISNSKPKPISYRSPYTMNKLERFTVFDTSKIIPTKERTIPSVNDGILPTNKQNETNNSLSPYTEIVSPFHNKRYLNRPYHNKQRANIKYKEWIKNYLNDHYYE